MFVRSKIPAAFQMSINYFSDVEGEEGIEEDESQIMDRSNSASGNENNDDSMDDHSMDDDSASGDDDSMDSSNSASDAGSDGNNESNPPKDESLKYVEIKPNDTQGLDESFKVKTELIDAQNQDESQRDVAAPH